MSTLHRQKRGNGPPDVVERKGSGETHGVEEADSHPQRFGDAQLTEGHQALSGPTMSQIPCPHRTVSSSSSGYVSSDSVPSSPLTPPPYRPTTQVMSTQTPSPSSQAITHAVQRLSDTQLSRPSDEPWFFQPSPDSASQPAPAPVAAAVAVAASAAGDMQPEESVARELRRIGDEFNLLYFHEPHDEGNGQAVLARLRDQLPNGPGVMLFIGLLIGRLFQYIMRRR
ncbi:bcl-2-like protein 11 [Engraulis encrasicolus]|uniref:bcl-2-like protein 11 n=1 Tax=Engraulis encrasicolus TaxID=184585 RepID=UPI002FD6CE1A